MPKAASKIAENLPPIMDRIAAVMGNSGRFAKALGVNTGYMTKWRRLGFIPEEWALEVERLNLSDGYGRIDAYAVLYAAERAKRERYIAAVRAEREARKEQGQD